MASRYVLRPPADLPTTSILILSLSFSISRKTALSSEYVIYLSTISSVTIFSYPGVLPAQAWSSILHLLICEPDFSCGQGLYQAMTELNLYHFIIGNLQYKVG